MNQTVVSTVVKSEEALLKTKLLASQADEWFLKLSRASAVDDLPRLMTMNIDETDSQSGCSGESPSSSGSQSPGLRFSSTSGTKHVPSTWPMSSHLSPHPEESSEASAENSPYWSNLIDLTGGKEKNVQGETKRYFLSSTLNLNDLTKLNMAPNNKTNNNSDFALMNNHDAFSLDQVMIYPLKPCQQIQQAAVFFLETPPGNHLPEACAVQVNHPNEFTLNLKPSQDYRHQDRYVCSFIPPETGKYTMTVVLGGHNCALKYGKPHEFYVSRNYDGTGQDLVSNISVLKLGFGRGDFLGKGWGIGVYRPTNMIYLADRENHKIVILDQSGKQVKSFGKEGHGKGHLFRPTGIAVDSKNKRVYVTDKDNHRVIIYSLQGSLISSFGRKGHQNGEFNYPWGIAVSPDGNLIAVADSRNHRIQLFDAKGNFIRKFSVFETNPFEYKNEFNYPRGLCFSLDGSKIYVADFNIHAVFALNIELTSKVMLTSLGTLMRPQGLTVDEAGNILIADSKNNCIRVISPWGSQVCVIDGTGPDGFDMPMDVAVLSGGRVAVTDAEKRFRIF